METLSKLLNELERHAADVALVFETGEGRVSPGYHVTELRHSVSKGIDCGGRIDTWHEARLQLLDGYGTTHMSVGKFAGILSRSLSAMPELRDVPVTVEFGRKNAELRLLSLTRPARRGDRVVILLGNTLAVCKPMERARSQRGDAPGEATVT